MSELVAFEPATPGATSLFLDTSGLYPYFYERAAQHETVTAHFEALADGTLAYRPLFTNQFVLDELVSLLLAHADHRTAVEALAALRESMATTVLSVTDGVFERAASAFAEYADHGLSLTDHTIGVEVADHDVGHVLAYDRDFEDLGLTVVPRAAAR